VVKLILKDVAESQFLLLRFSISLGILVAFLTLRGENLRIAKEHFRSVFFLGVLGVGVYNIIWTAGIHKTTAANAALLISTSPIFTTLYSAFKKEETITRLRWSGIACAFGGILMIVGGSSTSQLRLDATTFQGNIIILAGSILFSFYNLLARPLLCHYSAGKLTTLAMAFGWVIMIPYALAMGSFGTLPGLAMHTCWEMAYVILFGTVLAYILWYEGIRQVGPVKAVLYHLLVPIMSMVMGSLLLGERIGFPQIIGAGLVFAGLALTKDILPGPVRKDPKSISIVE
jgi:drug/metabolite transporter (DMT)-like permease